MFFELFDQATNIDMDDGGKFIDLLAEWLDDIERGLRRRNSYGGPRYVWVIF